MSLILKQEPANTIATPPAGKSTLFVTDNSVMAIKTPAGTVTQFPTVQGANTQVFFNDDGAINGSANLAFVKTTNTLTLTGGNVVATGVKTDNLYYANGNPWDLDQPAGSNTQLQFNNNGSFGASANLTFDGTSLTLTGGNVVATGVKTSNLYYANGNPWDLDQPAGSNTQLQFNNNGSFGASANLTFNGTTLLVGAAALQTDFPNATVIISQANTGQTHSENIGVIGEAVADSGNTSTWGIGVLGEARANGATKATGVQGGGYVTASADTGAAVGVRGYSIQTHSGGYNIGVLGNAAGSGLGNYAFYVQAGNIGSIETATTWDLTDNSIAALTFQSTGKANIFGIETTDGAEGIYTQGYLNVTGNITATAGIKTDNYYYANGSPVDFQQAGGSNTQIQFNDANGFGGSAAFTFNNTTNVVTISNGLSVTANATVGNLSTAGLIAATGNISGGNLTSNGNLTASSAATVTFGDNTTLYSGYTTMNPVGVFHNTANGEGTLQVASGNLANGIAIWTNNVANSFIQATGGIEFITGSTLRANLNPTGGTTQMALTTSGLTVANTLQANIVNSSTTMNAIGNINAGNFVTTGNIQASGTIYSNTSISTIGNITSGGNMFSNANLGCETALYVGNGAGLVGGLDNPLVLTTGTGTKYVQAAIINKNANGSADWIAYGNNGNSVAGWMDMGFTGATFSDANYTITGNNDGYIFSKAVGGANLGGNLVVATGSTGTTNDIVFATGGFLTANEKMRFINASNQFYVEPTTVSTSTTTGALRVGGGVGIAGNVYAGALINAVGNITGGNLVTAGVVSATGNVTGNFFIGNGSQLTGIDATAIQNGNSNVRVLTNANVTISSAGNANIVVVTGTGANVAGTLNVTGNANVGNLGTSGLIVATGNVTGGNLVTAGALSVTGNANTGNLGTTTLVATTGNITTINSGLLQSGNSNVSITANANVAIAVTGANRLVLTSTGANITGTANVSGNANVGNIGAAAGVFTTVAGALTTAAQPNVTSLGTLTSLAITGNATAGNVYANSGTIGASLLTGTLTTAAQPNVTSVGTLTSLAVTGNGTFGNINTSGTETATRFISNIATGTAPLTVTSTTRVANLNVDYANVADNINVTAPGTGTGYLIFANATTGNVAEWTSSGISSNLANNSITATTFVGSLSGAATSATSATTAGTVTTAAQPNITSTGTLTSLTVSGNANVGNLGTAGLITATGNVSGGNLTTGGLVSATGNITSNANVVTDLIVGRTSGITITATGTNQNINLVPTGTGTVNVGNFIISNVATPVSDFDAATKKYVDDVSQGLNIHDSCNAATTATLATISGGVVTYNNGTSGVGATLTTTGTYTTIDGVTLSNGMRILVKNETNAANNGIYVRTSATVLTRATDFNSVPEIEAGDFTFVTAGTLYDNTGWVQTATVTTIGTDPIDWTQFSGAGTYTAGTGLTLTGSQFSVSNTSVSAGSYGNGDYNATFTVNGQGQLTAAANVAITANAGNLSGTVLKSTVVTSSLTSVGTLGSLSVTGNISAGNVSATTFTGALSGAATTAGTVTTAAQPNITSTGTLTSLAVTGNISAGNVSATTFTGALSGAATTAGTVTTAAQPNITSVGTLTSLGVSGAVVASTLTSNVATGTAPMTVTSTTRVANLNVAYANVADNINVTTQSSGNAFLIFANALTGNVSETANATFVANTSNCALYATTFIGALSGAATTAGTVTTAAQPNITSTGTLTSLAVTGNISAGNVSATTFTGALSGAATTAGTVTTAAQPNITSVGTLSALSVTATITGSVSGTAATVTTAAQPNITSVGTLTSLAVTGNISAGNVSATTFTGALSGAATTAGTVTTAAQPNITSTGTLTSLTVTGNAAAGNVTTAGQLVSSVATGTAPIVVSSTTQVANLNVATAGVAGTVTSAAQPNITSVGTLSALSVTATITGSVSGTAATVTTAAQPNITSVGTLTSLAVTGNISGANVTATYYGAATGLTGIPGANITGTIPSGVVPTLNQNTSGYAATVSGAAQGNITSVGTLTSLTVSGSTSVTGNSALTTTNLTTGANTTAGYMTGTWTLTAGSKLNATYADLAEKYVADADYEPGTVLVFGGTQEVTLSTDSDSFRVAGVVTTNPAYTMNNECEGEHVATIALQGRLPVKVIGPVYKGDLLVSCGNGHAIANNIARAGTIIGKSLENFNEATGVIEVAVGRF